MTHIKYSTECCLYVLPISSLYNVCFYGYVKLQKHKKTKESLRCLIYVEQKESVEYISRINHAGKEAFSFENLY